MATLLKTPPKITAHVDRHLPWVAFVLGLVLIAMTVGAHFPAVFSGYIWDDDVSLYENRLIAAPDGLYKLWFTSEATDYWPLTATMFWLEWRMWGNAPTPYHVANILLHAIAAVLLWRVLLRLKVGMLGSFLAGLLFAIHPVTVESVAWISERKNLLSMVLFLLALLAYLRFDDNKQMRWYSAALAIALAALLAKSSVVMLPIILLMCIWWRRLRVTRQDFLQMLPFFAMSLILGLVTIWFQRHHAIADAVVRPEGIASRIAAVGWVFWFYLYKLVMPINLAMIYPRWDIDGGNVISYLPLALLITCFVVLWRYRNSWGRGPLAALAVFAVILAPVLGLLDMSYARFSLVADHLQYPGIPAVLALIGAGLATAWSWLRNRNRMAVAHALSVVIGATVLALAVLTWRQARLFGDNITLWSHTIALNDRAWAAYGNLACFVQEKGQYEQAIQYYSRSIALKPDNAEAYNNRGVAYGNSGKYDLEIRDCTRAIELKPDFAKAYNSRGVAYSYKGDYDGAIRDCTKAIELQPDYAEAYGNRGFAHSGKRDYEQAIQDYSTAISIKPGMSGLYVNRGIAYAAKVATDLAIQDYSRAIDLQPNSADAYHYLANAYRDVGNYDRAIQNFTKAIELKPNYPAAYNDRATTYGMKGDTLQAIEDYTKAIELDPKYIEPRNNRAAAYFGLKQYDNAWADVKRCRELGGQVNPDFIKALTHASSRPG